MHVSCFDDFVVKSFSLFVAISDCVDWTQDTIQKISWQLLQMSMMSLWRWKARFGSPALISSAVIPSKRLAVFQVLDGLLYFSRQCHDGRPVVSQHALPVVPVVQTQSPYQGSAVRQNALSIFQALCRCPTMFPCASLHIVTAVTSFAAQNHFWTSVRGRLVP